MVLANVDDGVLTGKSAVELLGGGTATAPTAFQKVAVRAFRRHSGIQGIDIRVLEDI